MITSAQFYAMTAAQDVSGERMLISCLNERSEWACCPLYEVPEGWDSRAHYPHEAFKLAADWSLRA